MKDVIVPDGSNMISVEAQEATSWQRYQNEQGDFDPPGGARIDSLLNQVVRTSLKSLAEDVIDETVGKPLRQALLAIRADKVEAVRRGVADLAVEESVKEQVNAAADYHMAATEDDMGSLYAELVELLKGRIGERLAANM